MAVAMLVDNPEGSQEIYEEVRKKAGLDQPAGGILHLAGPSPKGGWRVIEVFDSEEEAQRFLKDRLGPAFREVGLTGPPQSEFWVVHNVMTTAPVHS